MISKSFGTHDGPFHADEVTACALLLLFGYVEKSHIYRTRDSKILQECEFVCDVEGEYDPSKKRFDHHQLAYQGGMSSAGMILLFLKDQGIIDKALYDHFNRVLILGVDAHDVGNAQLIDGVCTFSDVIDNFMPVEYNFTAAEEKEAFEQALDFTYGHLLRLKERFFHVLSSREKVKKEMEKNTIALIFDEAMPWMESFFELGGETHPGLFLIMPSGEHWKLRAIPPSYQERMQVRLPLPESWAGLREEELEAVSKIKGAIFCHKGKFISIWKTKQAAVKALKETLKMAGVDYE